MAANKARDSLPPTVCRTLLAARCSLLLVVRSPPKWHARRLHWNRLRLSGWPIRETRRRLGVQLKVALATRLWPAGGHCVPPLDGRRARKRRPESKKTNWRPKDNCNLPLAALPPPLRETDGRLRAGGWWLVASLELAVSSLGLPESLERAESLQRACKELRASLEAAQFVSRPPAWTVAGRRLGVVSAPVGPPVSIIVNVPVRVSPAECCRRARCNCRVITDCRSTSAASRRAWGAHSNESSTRNRAGLFGRTLPVQSSGFVARIAIRSARRAAQIHHRPRTQGPQETVCPADSLQWAQLGATGRNLGGSLGPQKAHSQRANWRPPGPNGHQALHLSSTSINSQHPVLAQKASPQAGWPLFLAPSEF